MLDKIEGLVTGMRGALDNVSHDSADAADAPARHRRNWRWPAPPDVDRYREALADCVEETDRVLVMLNTLMDISEAESGAMPLQREPVRSPTSSRARSICIATWRRRKASRCDDVRRTTCVVSRRSRAARAGGGEPARQRGQVHAARAGASTMSAGREGGRAVLRVRDTGLGHSADELPRIWDRLFRGDRSRTERGLGLGLSLVKAIVEAHGGTVSVDSEPGRGSTFTVVACPARSTSTVTRSNLWS